jgi:hypothetical protein
VKPNGEADLSLQRVFVLCRRFCRTCYCHQNTQAKAELAWVDYSNATDLTSQFFYRFLEATWFPQFILRFALTYVSWGVGDTPKQRE